MPNKIYLVNLSEDEQHTLHEITCKGMIKARKFKRAMILLKADKGLNDCEIMEALNVSCPTVERARKRFVEGGLEKALNENPRPGQKRRLDGRGEAVLIAEACSEAPAGYEQWTMRLLAGRLVELGVVNSISHETVRQTLKKTQQSLGRSKCGAFQ